MDTIIHIDSQEIRITWIHASYSFEKRRICERNLGAWLVVGDFNEIERYSEKGGGRRKAARNTDSFKELLFDLKLTDIGFSGKQCAWSNRKRKTSCFRPTRV